MGVSPPRKRRPRLLNALHLFEKSSIARGIAGPLGFGEGLPQFHAYCNHRVSGRQRSYARVNFQTTGRGWPLEIPDFARATVTVAGGCWTFAWQRKTARWNLRSGRRLKGAAILELL